MERVARSQRDWLFLVGGSNSVLELFDPDGFSSRVDVLAWADRLEVRGKFAKEINAEFRQLVVPEKLSAYSEYLPEVTRFEQNAETPGSRIARLVNNAALLYPLKYLLQQKKQYQIYPRTDSHWTWIGAFSAFQMLMTDLKIEVDFNSFVSLSRKTISYHGDLWEDRFSDIGKEEFQRIDVPDSIKKVYCNSLMGIKEKYSSSDQIGLHVGSHCIFVNNASEKTETVVIFGSSFSECRLECSLLTFIFSHYFREVHFIWSSDFDISYLERHKPNLIIGEIPERFVTHCPTDMLSIEEFAAKKTNEWARHR